MTRRVFSLALALGLLVSVAPAVAQEANVNSIWIMRDSDRNLADSTDYREGDIVEVWDDPGNFTHSADTSLYPPFWYVRVEGIGAAEAKQYMASVVDQNTGALKSKRAWSLKINKAPRHIQDFLRANHFAGFGSQGYIALLGASVPAIYNDTVIPWSVFRTWLNNKVTNQSA